MPATGIPKTRQHSDREKYRRVQKNILELTLEQLHKLYKDNPVRPGRLIRLAIKPHWNTVLGSNNECGMATNFMGIHGHQVDRTENQKFLNLVGKPLFEIADRGIHATDLHGTFPGYCCNKCTFPTVSLDHLSIRNRGFLAQCWIPGDKLVQQYPTLSRLVTKNDIVTIVGYGNEVRNLRGRCRELHVIDMLPQEAFETVIIDNGITYGPRDIVVHSAKDNEKV